MDAGRAAEDLASVPFRGERCVSRVLLSG
jgi:hypothetical protein